MEVARKRSLVKVLVNSAGVINLIDHPVVLIFTILHGDINWLLGDRFFYRS